MLYLDHAATSFPKPEVVYEAADRALRTLAANPGRSAHRLSLAAAREVYSARETLAAFLGLQNPMNLIFTANATDSLNLALYGLLSAGDHVVTTVMEHNSVLRPLTALEKKGIRNTVVNADGDGAVSTRAVEAALEPGTRLVVMTHASNVTGTIQPVAEVGKLCREKGILFLVDASQSAGTLELNMAEMGIDLLAAPGHKSLLGLQGTGILAVGEKAELRPMRQGGTGSHSIELVQPLEMPDRLESGTLNVAGISALAAGIRWTLEQGGPAAIRLREEQVTERFLERLRDDPRVRLYGPPLARDRAAVVSLNIVGMDCSQAAWRLDNDYEIAVRSGLHCAPLAHRAMGTEESGTVRFSFGWNNTLADADRAADAVLALAREAEKLAGDKGGPGE